MQQVGPYTVLGELARGGMGVVYRARHAQLGREVAIKVLRAGKDASDVQRRRFETEARTVARLRHPNIVVVHDVGEERGAPFLVMDLVDGETLADRLLREGPMAPAEAARVGAALARALQHAHEHQVLHRDVKPDNVLLARDGTPLLTDFGLAKDLDESRFGMSVTGRFMGTPGFMPPEQAQGQLDRMGPASDVFALGATLHAMLTAAAPFEGESVAEVMLATVEQAAAAPSARRPGLDRDLDLLVLRCLEKDPARRYGSAGEVAEQLERYLRRSSRADAPRPAPRAPSGRPSARPGGAPAPPATAAQAPAARAAAAGRWSRVVTPLALVWAVAALGLVVVARRRAGEAEGEALRAREALAEARGRTEAAEGRAAQAARVAAAQERARLEAEEARQEAEAALEEARGALDARRGAPSSAGAAPDPARARELVAEARARLTSDRAAGGAGAPLARVDALLGRALEADPRSGEAWRLRADVRLALGRPREAAEDATRALALDARDQEARLLRASALGDLGDFRGLIEDATRALELDPGLDRARELRGWGRQARGDPLGAIADFELLIARTQDEARAAVAYNNRGIARVALGRAREGIDDLTRALELDEAFLLPLLNRGMARALEGDRAGALADFARAAAADPALPEPALWIHGLDGDGAALEVAARGSDFHARIALAYLNRVTEPELLAEAERPRDGERASLRRCAARGFLGLLADRRRDLERAAQHYQACVDTGEIAYTVSFWAAARLRQLAR